MCKSHRVSVGLSEIEAAELDAICEKLHMGRSDALRACAHEAALSMGIDRSQLEPIKLTHHHKRPEPGWAYELAQDIGAMRDSWVARNELRINLKRDPHGEAKTLRRCVEIDNHTPAELRAFAAWLWETDYRPSAFWARVLLGVAQWRKGHELAKYEKAILEWQGDLARRGPAENYYNQNVHANEIPSGMFDFTILMSEDAPPPQTPIEPIPAWAEWFTSRGALITDTHVFIDGKTLTRQEAVDHYERNY